MLSVGEKKRVELIPTKQNPETHLELSVGYQHHSHNWYNGTHEHSGYFLYCCPVQRRTIPRGDGTDLVTWSQQLGKGKKKLLVEVSRRGKKAEKKAVELAVETEAELIQAVCCAYGLVLKEAA